jgi:hypothetical protein
MPSPKNATGSQDEKHHEEKDMRRAYEHLGRVEILQQFLQPASAHEVGVLVALAQQEIQNGHKRQASELLRASEHLSFAALGIEETKKAPPAKDLERAISEEFEHLTHKAEERWEYGDRHEGLAAIYKFSLQTAKTALKHGEYHPALELARAADALAGVKQHEVPQP